MGAVRGDQKTGELWILEEQAYHINYLELKAVLLGSKSLCSTIRNKHIRIQSDNAATVAYVNAMGVMKSTDCNNVAKQIWQWCRERVIWLSACHKSRFQFEQEFAINNKKIIFYHALKGP